MDVKNLEVDAITPEAEAAIRRAGGSVTHTDLRPYKDGERVSASFVASEYTFDLQDPLTSPEYWILEVTGERICCRINGFSATLELAAPVPDKMHRNPNKNHWEGIVREDGLWRIMVTEEAWQRCRALYEAANDGAWYTEAFDPKSWLEDVGVRGTGVTMEPIQGVEKVVPSPLQDEWDEEPIAPGDYRYYDPRNRPED